MAVARCVRSSSLTHALATYGLQSAKTDFEVFKIALVLAENSSLGFVDDTQSESIGEKQEYMP